jgi:signal transduction histidine kinase
MDGALLVARTVAHDINNTLSSLLGFAELLGLCPSVSADPTAALYAQQIGLAAEEVGEKVRQLQGIIRLEETPSTLGPDQPLLDLEKSTAAG